MMTTIAPVLALPLSYTPPPKVRIQFRVLREGEVTSGPKFVRLYRSWLTISQVAMAFCTGEGDGRGTNDLTQAYNVDVATLLAQGEWLACGVDDAPPRKTRAVYLTISDSGVLTYNITSGEGSGGGASAEITARVRVDGVLAEREVVFVEKPSNGQFRIAGYGPAQDGESVIDLKVTDGLVYAVALDDWGTAFQPSLSVAEGQVIRPTVMLGWLYRVTQAGQLPAVEPTWWDESMQGPQPLGTARAEVVRYYRPQAHGPQPVELI
ncbi:hypothetical protein QA447_03570 [Pseudomonas sp. abacavir_1]